MSNVFIAWSPFSSLPLFLIFRVSLTCSLNILLNSLSHFIVRSILQSIRVIDAGAVTGQGSQSSGAAYRQWHSQRLNFFYIILNYGNYGEFSAMLVALSAPMLGCIRRQWGLCLSQRQLNIQMEPFKVFTTSHSFWFTPDNNAWGVEINE